MTSPDYFDDLYADSADPWDLAVSEYEQRKLALLLAALPSERYRSGFEPGCAIGVTTAALAARCDRLLAMDVAAAAVEQARARVTSPRVVVTQGWLPRDWPAGPYDLIVLSELLYYLDDADRLAVADLVDRTLAPAGDLVAVHWRHGFVEAVTDGDVVHAELAARLSAVGLTCVVDQVDKDFRLQVYHRARSSPPPSTGPDGHHGG